MSSLQKVLGTLNNDMKYNGKVEITDFIKVKAEITDFIKVRE